MIIFCLIWSHNYKNIISESYIHNFSNKFQKVSLTCIVSSDNFIVSIFLWGHLKTFCLKDKLFDISVILQLHIFTLVKNAVMSNFVIFLRTNLILYSLSWHGTQGSEILIVLVSPSSTRVNSSLILQELFLMLIELFSNLQFVLYYLFLLDSYFDNVISITHVLTSRKFHISSLLKILPKLCSVHSSIWKNEKL